MAIVVGMGVADYYPWPFLNFAIGFSGAIMVLEMVLYLLELFFYYSMAEVDPRIDVKHPDRFGGIGLLAEDGNRLVRFLLWALILGNAFFLTPLQLHTEETSLYPSRLIPFIPEPLFLNWGEVMIAMSAFCTTVALSIYLLIHVVLLSTFEQNRRKCIQFWEKRFYHSLDSSSASKGEHETNTLLEQALAMRVRPTNPSQFAGNLTLVATGVLGFFASSFDILGLFVS